MLGIPTVLFSLPSRAGIGACECLASGGPAFAGSMEPWPGEELGHSSDA